MSNLDVSEFHAFLDGQIKESLQEGNYNPGRLIQQIRTKHPEKIKKIQAKIDELGLRALIKSNGRLKRTEKDDQPTLFRDSGLGNFAAVPYTDENGKFRWKWMLRSDLSLEDVESIVLRRKELNSREREDGSELEKLLANASRFKNVTSNFRDALKMAAEEKE